MKRTIDLVELFRTDECVTHTACARFSRVADSHGATATTLLDSFTGTAAVCCFLRCAPDEANEVELAVMLPYSLSTLPSGGWLLSSSDTALPAYWIPQPPMLRTLDEQGHILSHGQAEICESTVSADGLGVTARVPAGTVLDLVVWQIPAEDRQLVDDLASMHTLELQRYFLWSSHTPYDKPDDIYQHLVFGHVYENHEVWPKFWRVCSELDAYALYVTLTGLLRATGKRLYDLLRTQIVFSVIARQAGDGGWYHGEWTDGMESHYRLHAGAMHLLAAFLEETGEPVVKQALDKAAGFAAQRIDQLDAGAWFLHDDLEKNENTIKRYPFRVVPSRVLGKSKSNLLVLNTHLDTCIAMARYQAVTGDTRYQALVESAQATSRAIVGLRPADWLYGQIYKAIGLTFLPTKKAAALPLHIRIVKRLTWQYLTPLMPRIKTAFPRLVMPNGYIERHLVQSGISPRYQPVNVMDLARTRHLFSDAHYDTVLAQACAFTQQSGIRERWKERKGKEDDSLGFWSEALYFMCLISEAPEYRQWLADAVIDLEDNRLGLSPSLLGGNLEALGTKAVAPCPSPTNDKLRVVNLSTPGSTEFLVVNPTSAPISLAWETPIDTSLGWRPGDATAFGATQPADVAPRRWVWARQGTSTVYHANE